MIRILTNKQYRKLVDVLEDRGIELDAYHTKNYQVMQKHFEDKIKGNEMAFDGTIAQLKRIIAEQRSTITTNFETIDFLQSQLGKQQMLNKRKVKK